MQPKIITDINQAAQSISQGSLVSFPTETVYGLGADATNDLACLKIYQIKNRPLNNPLIIHVAKIEEARNLGIFDEFAEKLANYFWPGPLTLVLNKKNKAQISSLALAGLDTIALRIPSNKLALELLKKVNLPIAAPSANKFGHISPTTKDHVFKEFNQLDNSKKFSDELFILDSADLDTQPCQEGIESTIIDCTGAVPKILRYGAINADKIQEIIGCNLLPANLKAQKTNPAPGMYLKHYAPYCSIRINANKAETEEVVLNFGDSKLEQENNLFSLNLSEIGDFKEASRNLYSHLRILEEYVLNNGLKGIVVANIPNDGVGMAINDKLDKASFHTTNKID